MKEHAPEQLKGAWLRVREDRPVSNRVESDLGVKHESPQAILIEHGNASWHASHGTITEKAIEEAIPNP